jgi:hypothetical protein
VFDEVLDDRRVVGCEGGDRHVDRHFADRRSAN